MFGLECYYCFFVVILFWVWFGSMLIIFSLNLFVICLWYFKVFLKWKVVLIKCIGCLGWKWDIRCSSIIEWVLKEEVYSIFFCGKNWFSIWSCCLKVSGVKILLSCLMLSVDYCCVICVWFIMFVGFGVFLWGKWLDCWVFLFWFWSFFWVGFGRFWGGWVGYLFF